MESLIPSTSIAFTIPEMLTIAGTIITGASVFVKWQTKKFKEQSDLHGKFSAEIRDSVSTISGRVQEMRNNADEFSAEMRRENRHKEESINDVSQRVAVLSSEITFTIKRFEELKSYMERIEKKLDDQFKTVIEIIQKAKDLT